MLAGVVARCDRSGEIRTRISDFSHVAQHGRVPMRRTTMFELLPTTLADNMPPHHIDLLLRSPIDLAVVTAGLGLCVP